MTLQQNQTRRTGPEKTDANLEAITEEMVIATEACTANTTPPAGGDRDDSRKYCC